ncbi:MAG: hypothetical protein WC809_02000 [Sinimarinibacterium sp.]|jgi:hypothetical protein
MPLHARHFPLHAPLRFALVAALLALPFTAAAADEHAHHHHHAVAADAPVAAPPLSILLPENGAVVGRQLAIVFETPGDMAAMTMDAPVIGVHLHIESDEVSMMPTSKQLIRLGGHRYLFVFDLPAKPGEQTLKVYWGDAMHRTIEASVQKVKVRIEPDAPATR